MSRTEMQGIVTMAEGPDGGWGTGNQVIYLAVKLPDGRTFHVLDRTAKAPIEQWVLRGMTVAVELKSRNPNKCDVLMDRIPPLSQRIARGDWAMCNLESVHALVLLTEFDIRETARGTDPAALKPLRDLAQWMVLEAARLKQAKRPAAPVTDPDGRLRGTADLVSCESKPGSLRGNSGAIQPSWRARRLIRIWPYGHAPYVIMDEAKLKDDKTARGYLPGGSVPVSIDPADPEDVRYLWDEHHVETTPQPRTVLEVTDQMAHYATLQQDPLYPIVSSISGETRAVLAARLRESGTVIPDEWLAP